MKICTAVFIQVTEHRRTIYVFSQIPVCLVILRPIRSDLYVQVPAGRYELMLGYSHKKAVVMLHIPSNISPSKLSSLYLSL
jgi:hypothetical protein